ncbi:F-box/LRR-repeat protein 7-like [Cylas formicarius]|uniref:F-box/LRR-repeat protein 7-like n=1 Tax=Cylas formicarius TaxID=197179 RepID=UPI002958AF1A|nr:F-box/LRR-repeat protein 7-like [Cylas formicarius]XP_060516150.1 F-box/LRR-repeat protein 7-like [Cylas formicarius]XP_060516151.1 F-box/LRR-repeat protein 7-like [Cylas formicarius]
MNQPPTGLHERLSPRLTACPLVRLGHNNSSTDETNTSNDDADKYHYQYGDFNNLNDERYYRNPSSVSRSYRQNRQPSSEDSDYLHSYYDQPRSYLDYDRNSMHSPLASGNLNYSKESVELSSLFLSRSYWDDEYESKEAGRETSDPYFRMQHKVSDTHYLLDSFSQLGKSSPSLDQGYATLVAPTGSLANNIWSDGNIYKGKRYQSKNNSFDKLSDELVVKIFSFLNSIDLSLCAQVCRRFDTLAWTPSLWRVISLEGDHISGDKAIRGVLRQLCGQGRTGACPSVEKLHVGNGAKLSDKSLMLIAKRCPELTHLQLQGCPNITNNALFEIATRCTNLQHLDLTGCTKISCISLNTLSDPTKRMQLQYLDLTDCVVMQDGGLRIVVQNCPQLAYLYLRRCIQITDAGLKFVPSFCSALRELSVSDCSNVTDFGLYELAKLGPTLRYLSVAKCDQVSDAGLKVIARKCYKLRYLNARGCEAVSDDAITVLARSCTRLRALDIGKCDVSDAGLRALAECCPNLKKLSLRNCELVTDRGVQCIAYYCRGLQQLNIQDCQISLEGYRAVKKYCKRCVIEHTNPGFF